MVNKYKVSHIRKALNAFEADFPDKSSISLMELEEIIKWIRKPAIYNIEELIRLLAKHIDDNRLYPVDFYAEDEVCKILSVRKLAMHHWRKKGYITFQKINTRTVKYDLNVLLTELKEIRAKTYQ